METQIPKQVSNKPNYLLYGAIGGVFLIVVVLFILLSYNYETPRKKEKKSLYCSGNNKLSKGADCSTFMTLDSCKNTPDNGCVWSGPPYYDCNSKVPTDTNQGVCNTYNTLSKCDPVKCNWSGTSYCNGKTSLPSGPACNTFTTQSECEPVNTGSTVSIGCKWSGLPYTCNGKTSVLNGSACNTFTTQSECEPSTSNGCTWGPQRPYCNSKDQKDTVNQPICAEFTDSKTCVAKTNNCVWSGQQ